MDCTDNNKTIFKKFRLNWSLAPTAIKNIVQVKKPFERSKSDFPMAHVYKDCLQGLRPPKKSPQCRLSPLPIPLRKAIPTTINKAEAVY